MQQIRLQSVGWRNAIPADELEVGDVILYNFGSTGIVTSIEKRGSSVYYTCCQKGLSGIEQEYQIRNLKTRLLAVQRVNPIRGAV